jgi:hypothetical protein
MESIHLFGVCFQSKEWKRLLRPLHGKNIQKVSFVILSLNINALWLLSPYFLIFLLRVRQNCSLARRVKKSRSTRTSCTLEFDFFTATPPVGNCAVLSNYKLSPQAAPEAKAQCRL